MSQNEEQEQQPQLGDVGNLDIGQMEAGDYMIHLFVENCKNLRREGGEGSDEVFDALVQLDCCGESRYSTVMQETLNDSDTATYLGEHFFFEPRGLSVDEIQSASIKINVLEKSMFKNRQVGSFDIDVAQIYFKNDQHAMHFQWIALFNATSSQPDQIKGFLKVSVAVQGPGDSSVKLTDEPPGSLEDTADSEIMMPSSLRKSFKQINIAFLKAEHLARMDFHEGSHKWCDPYVSLKFQKHDLKTKHTDYDVNTHTAHMDQKIKLPVQWPSSVDRLVLEVKDYDGNMLLGAGQDETIGSIVLSLKDLVTRFSQKGADDEPNGAMVWMNVYGAPTTSHVVTGPIKKRMNSNPELATTWKGRILMHIEVFDTESPDVKVETIDDIQTFYKKQMVDEAIKPKRYEILTEFGSGVNLPDDQRYRVKLQIGGNPQGEEFKGVDFCVTSREPVETYHKFNRWSQRFPAEEKRIQNSTIITTSYQSVEEMDRVYLYLLDPKDREVCFWRGRAADFELQRGGLNDKVGEFKWYPLQPNEYYGKVSNAHEAGLVQFRLTINQIGDDDSNKVSNWKEYPNWNQKLSIRNKYNKVRCYIFQCRDLPAADADGTSDAQISAYSVKREEDQREALTKTLVCDDNLNPIFQEALDIDVCYNTPTKDDLSHMPPFILDVDDYDKLGLTGILDSKDFLGRAVIDIASIKDTESFKDWRGEDIEQIKKANEGQLPIPTPKWHDIRAGNSQDLPSCGKVLCSFALCDLDARLDGRDEVKFDKLINTAPFEVKIHVLGLRELQSFGIMPVKKPFIKFNIRSLLPPGKSAAMHNIRTEPRDTGPNPNMNTVISFSLNLPDEELYCPKLPCAVYDQICRGLVQPKMGIFDIDLGAIQATHRRRFKRMKNNSEKLLKDLQDKLLKATQKKDKNIKRDRLSAQIAGRHFLKQNPWEDLADYALENQGDESKSESDDPENLFKHHDSSDDEAKPLLDKAPVSNAEFESQLDIRPSELNFQNLGLKIQQAGLSPINQVNASFLDEQLDENPFPRLTVEELSQIEERKTQIQPPSQEVRPTQGTVRDSVGSLFFKKKIDLIKDDSGKIIVKETLSKLIWGLIDELKSQSEEKDESDKKLAKEKTSLLNIVMKASSEHKAGDDLPSLIKKVTEKFTQANESRQKTMSGSHKSVERMNRDLQKIEDQILAQLNKMHEHNKSVQKEAQKLQSQKDTYELIKQGREVHRNVLPPIYKFDNDLKAVTERTPPPESLYVAVGYDDPEARKETVDGVEDIVSKHYRKYHKDELENNKEIIKRAVFYKAPIQRGQTRGASHSFLDSLLGTGAVDPSGFASTQKEVGYFKGHIVIENEEQFKEEESARKRIQEQFMEVISEIHKAREGTDMPDNIDIAEIVTNTEMRDRMKNMLIKLKIYSHDLMKVFAEANMQSVLLKLLKTPKQAIARLYLLEGFDFSSRDLGSFSDPYIVVRCGNKEYNRRDDYQVDEPNPKFFEVFEFDVSFPGPQPLVIESYDYDLLFGDDLIGRTAIDMDDRYFSAEWRSMRNKPIEYRELYHESTALAQGTVTCWLDIIERKNKKGGTEARLWDIKPEPVRDYQLRVAVKKCKNIPIMDFEGTSDVFIKAWLSGDSHERRETDTHWRETNGTPDFQYRLLFDTQSPKATKGADEQAYLLNLFAYDRDVLSSDFLASFEIDLKPLYEECRSVQKPISLNKKQYQRFTARGISFKSDLVFNGDDDDEFWLQAKPSKNDGPAGPAMISLDIRLVPGEEAKQQNVGAGRQEPNHSPELPAPAGRMEFTLNPITMLGQLVGPAFKAYIMSRLCCAICVALCIALSPQLIGNITSEIVMKSLGLTG